MITELKFHLLIHCFMVEPVMPEGYNSAPRNNMQQVYDVLDFFLI